VPLVVRALPPAGGDRDELVAQVDEGHPRYAAAQLEREQPSVEGKRLVDVADLERDVVDPHESDGHGLCSPPRE